MRAWGTQVLGLACGEEVRLMSDGVLGRGGRGAAPVLEREENNDSDVMLASGRGELWTSASGLLCRARAVGRRF